MICWIFDVSEFMSVTVSYVSVCVTTLYVNMCYKSLKCIILNAYVCLFVQYNCVCVVVGLFGWIMD